MSAETVFNDYYAAWNAHDATKVAALLHDDVVVEHVDVGIATGVKQVLGMDRGLIEAWEDVRLDAPEVIASGPDHVAFRGIFRGTHTGTLTPPRHEPLPASGNKGGAHTLGVLQLRDGKIARLTVAYDMGMVVDQLKGKVEAI